MSQVAFSRFHEREKVPRHGATAHTSSETHERAARQVSRMPSPLQCSRRGARRAAAAAGDCVVPCSGVGGSRAESAAGVALLPRRASIARPPPPRPPAAPAESGRKWYCGPTYGAACLPVPAADADDADEADAGECRCGALLLRILAGSGSASKTNTCRGARRGCRCRLWRCRAACRARVAAPRARPRPPGLHPAPRLHPALLPASTLHPTALSHTLSPPSPLLLLTLDCCISCKRQAPLVSPPVAAFPVAARSLLARVLPFPVRRPFAPTSDGTLLPAASYAPCSSPTIVAPLP
jgi:hypothetical protein